jgi:hypothetical protein
MNENDVKGQMQAFFMKPSKEVMDVDEVRNLLESFKVVRKIFVKKISTANICTSLL